MKLKFKLLFLVLIISILFMFIKNRDRFENKKTNTKPKAIELPRRQNSYVVAGDNKALVFWTAVDGDTESNSHPISHFIIQYHEIIGDNKVIHSKIVPNQGENKHYSVIIDNLRNDVQYLVKVVGMNKKGMGGIEEGNIVIPELGSTLLE